MPTTRRSELPPPAPELTPDMRDSLLRYASQITTKREDPTAVLTNVLPLEEWVLDATSEEDQRTRMHALARQHVNSGREDPDDDPVHFIADASKFYAYLSK